MVRGRDRAPRVPEHVEGIVAGGLPVCPALCRDAFLHCPYSSYLASHFRLVPTTPTQPGTESVLLNFSSSCQLPSRVEVQFRSFWVLVHVKRERLSNTSNSVFKLWNVCCSKGQSSRVYQVQRSQGNGTSLCRVVPT